MIFLQKYFLATIIISALLIGSTVGALPQTAFGWSNSDVHCGDTITQSVKLRHDVICNKETTGIIIGAGNLVLDCNGHRIKGAGGLFGVDIFQYGGITVKNCNIIGFFNGIDLEETANNNIKNNHLEHNGTPIGLIDSSGNTIQQNLAKNNNDHGFFVDSSSGANEFKNNKAGNNGGFGMEDQSIGSGTSGTANHYNDNKCWGNTDSDSNPSDLCI